MATPRNLEHGQQAERAACQFLVKNGMQLLANNYRSKYGEIDLIMQDVEHVVFVEVRSRSASDYGNAVESISRSKQNKIIKTAVCFLLERKWLNKVHCRFDIISVDLIEGSMKMQWIRDAFSTEQMI